MSIQDREREFHVWAASSGAIDHRGALGGLYWSQAAWRHQQARIDQLERELAAAKKDAERLWKDASKELPLDETPVLIVINGVIRIGELRWEHPTYEETYAAFQYWDDSFDDGQSWDFVDITHWMPLPATPITAAIAAQQEPK